ncbi:MAG: 1-acyl-sn-glycerol-3-phosphate acyltransferase [Ilumatobacteraceae bacterium]|nr:1-acyl-sn-glycerol-3-phosphate acyltransferase [Ilumatobacteraceae bacterium]
MNEPAASSSTWLAGDSVCARALYAVVRGLVHGLVIAATRIRIHGREHLPQTGAYVVAPVHRSYIDTPIVACLTRRRIRFMGKQEIWKYASLGRLFSALGAFPVARGSADREALRRCVAVLEGGEPLVLFPEGERKDGPVVQPLFDGAAFVAARAGVPIVPVGIGGSARVMPRRAKLLYPRKVEVVVGAPIVAEVGASSRASRRAITEMTERLSVELQTLFDEAQSRVG